MSEVVEHEQAAWRPIPIWGGSPTLERELAAAAQRHPELAAAWQAAEAANNVDERLRAEEGLGYALSEDWAAAAPNMSTAELARVRVAYYALESTAEWASKHPADSEYVALTVDGYWERTPMGVRERQLGEAGERSAEGREL